MGLAQCISGPYYSPEWGSMEGRKWSIKVALDPWLSRTGSFKPRRVAPMGEDLLVSDLIDEHTHRWQVELVNDGL